MEIRAKDISEGSGFVTLPVKAGDFRQFINSLLGSPQAIVKYYNGGFVCDQQLLKEVFQIFEQRITMQQHGSYLAKFFGVLGFEDGSEVEFNDIAQIITFNHLGNDICTSIAMTMQYVILNKDHKPEKQTISVRFSAPNKQPSDTEDMYNSKSPFFVGVELRIEFTDRTWAYDIVNLFTNFIIPRMVDIPRIAKISNAVLPDFVRFFPYLVFTVPFMKVMLQIANIRPLVPPATLLNDDSLTGISAKLNFIIQRNNSDISSFPVTNFALYSVIGMLLMAISLVFRRQIQSFIRYKHYGYILFSKASENYMKKQERSNSKGKFYALNFLALSLFIGVAGNFLTDAVKAWMEH